MLSDIFAAIKKFAVLDWIAVLILFISGYAVKYSAFPADFHPFIVTDIDHELAQENFTYGTLCILTYGVGSVLVVVLWLVFYADLGFIKALSSYVFSIALAMFFSAVIGRFVARPRPDTLERCGNDVSLAKCFTDLTPEVLREQFNSFPNTFAAESMAAALFYCLLFGSLSQSAALFTAAFRALPVGFALLAGAIKIAEGAARVDDVVAGYAVGILAAFISFSTYKHVLQEKVMIRTPAVTETSSIPMPNYK